METLKFKDKTFKVIAHRGLSGIEKENTCPAFVLAGSKSYYGIETDIHVTTDGKFLVCHDDNIQRVTGIDMIIEQHSYEELKNIPIFDTDDKTLRTDLRFPLLEDYITICKKYDKFSILELKNQFERKDIEKVVDIIKGLDYLDNVVFISFYPDNMYILRELLPDQRLQFLSMELTEELIQSMIDRHISFDLYYPIITKELVDRIHEHGLEVNCWTVNDLETAEKMKACGVDYITTNIIE